MAKYCKLFNQIICTIFLYLVAVVLCSCEKKEAALRSYEEIVSSSPLIESPSAKNDPHAGLFNIGNITEKGSLPASASPKIPLIWVTPESWVEQKGDGLRLVTFRSGGDTDRIECSIVSLLSR